MSTNTSTPATEPKKTPADWLKYASAVVGDIFELYPERDTPHPFVAVRNEVMSLLRKGVDENALLRAARNYRTYVALENVLPKYVVGPVRFYRDGMWERHQAVRVEGRTREQWALSGQDVAEFDRLVGEVA